MQPSLLATKLTIPPLLHRTLPRTRLVDALARALPRHRLILIAAPAGYGKTTLLAQWAQNHAAEPGDRLRFAWLSLDEEDNAVERFFRYLMAAWQTVQPDVMDTPLGLLLSAMRPDSEAVLSAFINLAYEATEHTVFVLDDYHLITEPAIHSALTFLLDHLPPLMHFVLACRAEPPLPLARYRARQALFELHAADLSFLAQETAAFLTENMALALGHDDVVRLQRQSEGWIAGLQLAALSLRRRGVSDAAPIMVSGRHRFIADYLAQDVLAQQPPQVRDFLLKTSILERLSGPLCDAVTVTEDGQQMLEFLERENLFLAPLDDNRDWFRYHGLFAQFLQEEARRQLAHELADLHRRAAEWYLDHDLAEQAFDHALAAGDLELVIRIGERYFFVKLHNAEFRLLNRWLNALPADWYAAYPLFTLTQAGVLAFTGALDASMRCIEKVEQTLRPAETDVARWQLARATAVRCFMACFQDNLTLAEGYANQALAQLHEEDLTFRADTNQALGDAYRRHGRWAEAEKCYRKVLTMAGAPTYQELSIHAYGALADLELRQGRLQDAAAYWRKALQKIGEPQSWGRVPLPVSGWATIRMGEILYEWNELEQVEEHLARGLQRAELSGDVRAQIAGYLLAARLKLTQRDLEAVAVYLEKTRSLLVDAPFDEWQSRFQRLQLELWLAEDRLRAALHWGDELLQDDALAPGDITGAALSPGRRPEVQLALARLLIVRGDGASLQQASSRLGRLQQAAEAEGRLGVLIEALALQALAHWQRGDSAGAMTALARALRLAQPEGYVRLFVDLGLSMARLLQEARSRDMLPDDIARLLAAYDDGVPMSDPHLATLPEPLTLREQEVLELLAAGLTNREIGQKLIISAQTVKKHTGNIYGKLGVGNRTEAVARARQLDLLD